MQIPNSLTDEAKNIWKIVEKDFKLKDYQLIVLKTALEAYDRMHEAKKEIDKKGIITTAANGFEQKNPALQIEKEARSGFLAAWKALDLNIEPPQDLGRPTNKRDIEWDRLLGVKDKTRK